MRMEAALEAVLSKLDSISTFKENKTQDLFLDDKQWNFCHFIHPSSSKPSKRNSSNRIIDTSVKVATEPKYFAEVNGYKMVFQDRD